VRGRASIFDEQHAPMAQAHQLAVVFTFLINENESVSTSNSNSYGWTLYSSPTNDLQNDSSL